MTTEQEITREIETAAKSELDTVVRSIFDDPSASVVPGWIVGPLGSVSKGIGTLALLKVEGFAQTGGTKQGWSAVLKIMTLCAEGGVGQVGSVNGEVEAYRHGLFEDPSTGFRSARAYSITSKSADVVWLWTEDLSGYDGVPWSTEKYLQSAVTLGRKKGRLMGQSIQDYPWMNHGAGMDRWANPGIDKLFDVLATKRDSDYVRRALPKKMYDRVLRFGADHSKLTAAVSDVPRTVAHGDCHVRNLFTSPGDADQFELVAIDLASVGIEAIGSDLGTLMGSSLTWGDEEADTVMRVEEDFFEAFMNGFISEGAGTSRDLIRLSYLTSVCGYGKVVALVPAIVEDRSGPWEWVLTRYGGEDLEEDLPDSYRVRIEFITTLFDEALGLVDQVTGSK